MLSRLKDFLILTTAGLCLSTSLLAAQDGEDYVLLSRSTAGNLEVQLDPSQRQWVRNKRELIVSAP